MAQRNLTVTIQGDSAGLQRQIRTATEAIRKFMDALGPIESDPLLVDGWLCPRRSPLALVERSRGFLHMWVGPFGLHLARPLHRSRPDFCADWWR